MNSKKNNPKIRKELSVFDEELNRDFNPSEFLPDLPSHAKETSLHAQNEVALQKSEQTQNKVRTNPHHNPEQTQNKPRTKSEQQFVSNTETQNKVSTQPRTNSRTNTEQTQNKVRTNDTFLSLVGLQKRTILFIYDLCRAKGERTTGNLSLEQLSESCQTTAGAAQVTTRRLIKKGLLQRASYKNGRGGYTNYALPEEVYSELFQLESQNKHRTNPEQSQNNPPSQPRTQPRTTAPSSSSYLDLNNKTTTTENGKDREKITESLPTNPSWDKIDHNPLKEIGFNASHVAQIQSQGLHTPKTLQDSIYAFYYDLNANSKLKEITGPALNYFMGILRRGPYSPPANYESPEDEQLREYLEAKENLLEKRRAHLERIKALEFEEWADSLSEEEIKTLAPMGSSDTLKRSQLRNHFDEHIWSEKKKQISDKIGQGNESKIVLQYLENTSYPKGMLPPLHPPLTRI